MKPAGIGEQGVILVMVRCHVGSRMGYNGGSIEDSKLSLSLSPPYSMLPQTSKAVLRLWRHRDCPHTAVYSFDLVMSTVL